MTDADRPRPNPDGESPLAAPPRFEERVDLGSWARFEPSLADFLEQALLPTAVAGTDEAGERPGALGRTLLLTAPAPVVDQAPPARGPGLLSLLRRRRPDPSPEVPGLVLAGRGDGVEVDLPVLDARGRELLGPAEQAELITLGWTLRTDVLVRLLPGAQQAAAAVTRALIEVLRVPHPADLDFLLSDPPED